MRQIDQHQSVLDGLLHSITECTSEAIQITKDRDWKDGTDCTLQAQHAATNSACQTHEKYTPTVTQPYINNTYDSQRGQKGTIPHGCGLGTKVHDERKPVIGRRTTHPGVAEIPRAKRPPRVEYT